MMDHTVIIPQCSPVAIAVNNRYCWMIDPCRWVFEAACVWVIPVQQQAFRCARLAHCLQSSYSMCLFASSCFYCSFARFGYTQPRLSCYDCLDLYIAGVCRKYPLLPEFVIYPQDSPDIQEPTLVYVIFLQGNLVINMAQGQEAGPKELFASLEVSTAIDR